MVHVQQGMLLHPACARHHVPIQHLASARLVTVDQQQQCDHGLSNAQVCIHTIQENVAHDCCSATSARKNILERQMKHTRWRADIPINVRLACEEPFQLLYVVLPSSMRTAVRLAVVLAVVHLVCFASLWLCSGCGSIVLSRLFGHDGLTYNGSWK